MADKLYPNERAMRAAVASAPAGSGESDEELLAGLRADNPGITDEELQQRLTRGHKIPGESAGAGRGITPASAYSRTSASKSADNNQVSKVTSTTSKTLGIDPEVILAELNKWKLAAANQQDALVAAIAGIGKSVTAGNEARIAQASASGALANVDADISTRREENTVAINQMLGNDMLNPESMSYKANVKRFEAQGVMDKTLPEIQKHMRTSIFDDPIGWLAARVALPNLIDTYNSALYQKNAANASIADTSALSAAQQQTNPAVLGKLFQEQAAAKSVIAKQQALIDVSRANTEYQSILANSITTQLHMGQASLQMSMEVAKALATTESIRESNKLGISPDTFDSINFKRMQIGAKRFTPEEFKQLNAADKDFFIKLGGKNPAILGEDAGAALKFISGSSDFSTLQRVAPDVFKSLADIKNSKEYKDAAKLSANDPVFRKLSINDQEAHLFSEAQKAMTENGLSSVAGTGKKIDNTRLSVQNPYRAKLADFLIADENKNNPTAALLVDAFTTNKNLNEKDFLEIAAANAEANVNKKLDDPTRKSPGQLAKEFADFFTNGMTAQIANGPAKLGFPLTRRYGVEDTDVMSPAEVEHYFMTRMARAKFSLSGLMQYNVDVWNQGQNRQIQRGN